MRTITRPLVMTVYASGSPAPAFVITQNFVRGRIVLLAPVRAVKPDVHCVPADFAYNVDVAFVLVLYFVCFLATWTQVCILRLHTFSCVRLETRYASSSTGVQRGRELLSLLTSLPCESARLCSYVEICKFCCCFSHFFVFGVERVNNSSGFFLVYVVLRLLIFFDLMLQLFFFLFFLFLNMFLFRFNIYIYIVQCHMGNKHHQYNTYVI